MDGDSQWDVSFENIHYETRKSFMRDKKIILNDISGEFKQFELSMILGQSGSGKTTLLNVLSSYDTQNCKGSISIDGRRANARTIQQNTSYIMQEYNFHNFITVRETMMFTVNCKFYSRITSAMRRFKIDSILDELGLYARADEFVGNLSGGEQKRLSIALELIDNPKIMFFDEPTTGLDSCASTQCILLLKKLAESGRTIVCTIHQPSGMILKMFDYIYALADGKCIYKGACENLVNFLAELDLICPSTYNPSDYLLEIANNDNGELIHRLSEKISNAEKSKYRNIPHKHQTNYLKCDIETEILAEVSTLDRIQNEVFELTKRNFLKNYRDKTLTIMRLGIHTAVGFFVGLMYLGIGQEASNIFNIYKFLFFNVFVLMFTAFSSLQTVFPLELPIIKRECYNRMYTVLSYFIALTISDIPIIFVSNLLYISIAYFMTNQPAECFRFSAYFGLMLMLGLSAQGLGLIASSMLNVKFTLILGSFFMCPFVLFSNFFIQMKDSEEIFHILFDLSFIKYAFDGSMQVIFGFEREKMDCSKEYCHFQAPHKFLEFLDVRENFSVVLAKLFVFTLVFRFIALAIMNVRLKR